jgi:hypothetical protein
MTSGSIGWALLSGRNDSAQVLDHDVFDVSPGAAKDGDISSHLAAVHGVRAIASASGHRIKSLAVTWTEDTDGTATLLLRSLRDFDFDEIDAVKLPDAVRAWARAAGPVLGFEKCAICVVEPAAVTALSFGYDSVRTFSNHMRESADGIGRWLTSVFDNNGLEPESLFLLGARGDLELVSNTLESSLSIPVVSTDGAQLALARGAAMAGPPRARSIDGQVNNDAAGRTRTAARPRLWSYPRGESKADTIEAWTSVLKKPVRAKPVTTARKLVSSVPDGRANATAEPDIIDVEAEILDGEPDDAVFAPVTVAVRATAFAVKPVVPKRKPTISEAPTEIFVAPVSDEVTADAEVATRRWRYGPHARAATVVIVGLIAVFALGPVFFGHKNATSTDEPSASESVSTSRSVQVVPSIAVPPAALRQAVAVPAPLAPPVPVPPEVAPIEVPAAVPEAAVVAEAPPTAEQMAVPQAPQAPQLPDAAPVQAMAEPAPAATPPAPVPEAPAPVPAPDAAPPPLPGPPAAQPPPQDPVMALLDPLFGALP